MSLVVKRSTWPCKICSVTLPSPEELICHVVGNSHRSVLWNASPGYLADRLQFFLDTYATEEPVLGLEYVVEQYVTYRYRYTCQLCHVKEDWQEMFTHLIEAKHVVRYIDKLHPGKAPNPADFPDHQAYIRALVEVATEVYGVGSRRWITQQNGEAPAMDASDDAATTEDPSGSDNSLKRKMEMDCPRDAKQSRRGKEIRAYLKHLTNRDHFCSLCSVSCPTTVALYEHIMGAVHEENMTCAAPERRRELSRLHNFLDTYMKGQPILGLGHVAETEADSVYTYRCQLCGVQEDWRHIFTHLVTVDHVARHVDKHHRMLLPKSKNFGTRDAYVRAIILCAARIYKTTGDASMAEAATEDNGEEDDPAPSDGDAAQGASSDSKERWRLDFSEDKLGEITEELEELGVSKVRVNFCTPCNSHFSNVVELCKHLMGLRHKLVLRYAKPETLQKLTSLKFFLDTLLKNVPFVGLQYVLELKDLQYRCRLCNKGSLAVQMLYHISSAEHIMLYSTKHHRADFSFGNKMPKISRKWYPLEICKRYGRKEIQTERDGWSPCKPQARSKPFFAIPTWHKDAKEDISDIKVRPQRWYEKRDAVVESCTTEEKRDVGDPASAEAAKPQPPDGDARKPAEMPPARAAPPQTSAEQEMEMDAETAMEELEFRKNANFLDYLRAFEINDDEDASLAKQIVQNCTTALNRFLGERGEARRRHRAEHASSIYMNFW